MIVYEALSYVNMPALALPRMTLVSDALGENETNWPTIERATAWAAKQPAGWVCIDTEDGIWGAKYDTPTRGSTEVREFTLRLRDTIDAMKRVNKRLFFMGYGVHWTDQNGSLYTDLNSPDRAAFKAQQDAWNGPINKSRSYKDGTGLLSRMDAVVMNLYAGEGQAANGRGLAGQVEDNAETFRKFGRPRFAFISPDRQRVVADGDARFLPWLELQTQLDALVANGVEACVLWGGWGFNSDGTLYRMEYADWPAETRRKLNQWLLDHGQKLEL